MILSTLDPQDGPVRILQEAIFLWLLLELIYLLNKKGKDSSFIWIPLRLTFQYELINAMSINIQTAKTNLYDNNSIATWRAVQEGNRYIVP